MRLTDDRGQVLDAEYSVEPDGDHVAVILESKSGRADGRPPRNTDYRPALELILRRLQEREAVVEAAVVDSRRTHHLPESSRSLISRGSGYMTDQVLKDAIERHAVRTVMDHYRDVEKYEVEDVGDRKSYDIRALRGAEELHIEVKGSSGPADKVELTFNEVGHAHGIDTHLIVVDEIQWRRLPDGSVETSGGRARRWTAWTPAEEDLTPSRYWYRPPAHTDERPLPRHITT